MTSCPPTELLVEFLADRPEAGVAEHVDGCASCQSILDGLSDTFDLGQPLPHVIGPGLDRALAATTQAWSQSGMDYHFLSPATRPGDLGVLGSYHVESELGRGGMGLVFRAFDPTLRRTVALKVLRQRLEARDDARLLREAQAAARIAHANIVHILGVERTPSGGPYLVLEFVDGPTLSAALHTGGSLPPRRAAEVIAAVADGLAVLHSAGLIHRDVKPGNILLTRGDLPKLADFGLVRDESNVTTTARMAGTPAYMSPEAAQEYGRIDARSDVYGLGATLYECLTGDPPFHGSSAGIMQQVLRDEPRPPRRIDPTVPRDLEIICLKAMAKEPGRRYATAAELAADLRRWLTGVPIHARPAGLIERGWLWSRRNPRLAILSAALALAIVMGVVGITWQWQRARAETEVARAHLRDAMRTVDRFTTRLSEPGSALDQPGLQPLRRKLLQQAIEEYQEFLTRWPDEPELRVETAAAARRVALITGDIGSNDEALVAWDRAIAAGKRLVADRPNDSEQRDRLYESRFHRANALYTANRVDEAGDEYQRIRAVVEPLSRKPGSPKYRKDLASCEGSLANIAFMRGDKSTAAAHYRKSCAIYDALLQEGIDTADVTRKLMTSLTNLALTCAPAEQLPLYLRARQLLDDDPAPESNVHRARLLSRAEHRLGHCYRDLGRMTEAMAVWTTATERLAPLVAASPAVIDIRALLAELEANLGAAMTDNVRAIDHLQSAHRHFELIFKNESGSPLYRSLHAHALAALIERGLKVGDVDTALTAASSLATFKDTPEIRQQARVALTNAAKSSEWALKADLLREAAEELSEKQ